jgi:CMP-N-acetylneuraminic acid synthetase
VTASPPPAPRVSVYVTNHNYGRYVAQAIESVLRQTHPSWELLVVDDGSTDDSRAVIARYADDPRLVVIHQENRGLNVSNNIAIRAARGEYVMRLDADDYLDENALAVMAGVLDRHPDAGLVFPDYYVVDESGQLLEVQRRHDFADVTLLDQPAHGACTMIRRACLLELGGYDEAFNRQDGYDLWLRFTRRYGVRNVNLPLFYYRQHPTSLTRSEEKLLATRASILAKQAARSGPPLRAVAIVPVRGRAADADSPALRPLAGRPLIDWTLAAALESERVASVLVTSPDDDVLEHAGRYDARVAPIKRDRALAMPNTHIEATLLHALDAFGAGGGAADAAVLLYVESPFRSGRLIDSAVDVLQVFGTESVVGVRPDDGVFYQHHGEGLTPLRDRRLLRLERDELYREAGQLFVVPVERLRRGGPVVGGRVGHVVVDQRAAHRIRSEWDWRLAERIAADGGGPHTTAATLQEVT